MVRRSIEVKRLGFNTLTATDPITDLGVLSIVFDLFLPSIRRS